MDKSDNAGVRIPPPLVFLAALLAGLWWDSPWFAGRATGTGSLLLGGLITIAGLWLMAAGAIGHRRAGTNIEPWHPTTALITTGVYGYSRNPIYLGMATMQAGIAVCGASLGALVMIIPFLAFIQYYVITREERYLTSKFGSAYEDYKNQVRRWI